MSQLSLLIVAFLLVSSAAAGTIRFRSPDLDPKGLAYDHAAQHFLVGSTRQRTIVSVSHAGVVETLISDPDLPPDSAFLGLAVDGTRLLAAVSAPALSALAAYDLRSRRRLFLSVLSADPNGVAADPAGNAYVTSSAANLVWKVDAEGRASVFSNSSAVGLSGIAYVSKGYFLAVQAKTGKLFKVSERDGSARKVPLGRDLVGADDIAVRRDGATSFVVSSSRAWAVKSDDSWGEAAVSGEIQLEKERSGASLAVVWPDQRVYAVFAGGIEELRWAEERYSERGWIYVVIAMGMLYLMFWRFQMNKLISSFDKKII